MARPRPGLRRRRIDPAAEQTLRRTQANLSALANHTSWPDLEAAVADKARRMERIALMQALGGTAKQAADPLQLQWIKGFIAGMRYIVAVPRDAETSLRAYLEEQGIPMEGVEE